MTFLVRAFRCWAEALSMRRQERAYPAFARKLRPVPRRSRLEMRWYLDPAGRLTCTWRPASDIASARSNDEATKPPTWLWLLPASNDRHTYAKRQ
jgi:hypothetical protein